MTKRTAKVIFVLIVDLIILELSFRAIDAIYPLERPPHLIDTMRHQWLEGTDWLDGRNRFYVYEPNSVAKTYGHQFRVNRWGLRGGDFDRPRFETFRIMVLGDSFTAGIGVAEEDRYTNVLERLLRRRYPNRKVEVINLGVGGFETIQQEKMMRRMWGIVRPELTIVGFYLNDPQVNYDFYLPYKFPIPKAARRIVQLSLMFRLLEPWYDPLYRKINNLPSREAMMWRSYEPETEDWKLFERSVEAISRWVVARTGQSPISIFLSYHQNVDTMRNARDRAREVFIRNGFIWCEPEGYRYNRVSRFENHADENTHRWYAEKLFQTIVNKGLLDRDSGEGQNH